MTIQMETMATPSRNLWRSTGAVFLGFVAVVALSLGTDQVLHVLAVYPPWGQPMYATGLLLLALAVERREIHRRQQHRLETGTGNDVGNGFARVGEEDIGAGDRAPPARPSQTGAGVETVSARRR